MTPIRKTLLAILLFVAIALGGFIWFVSNWTAGQTSSFISPNKPRGLGQSPSPTHQPDHLA